MNVTDGRDALLRVREAASFLSICPRTLFALTKSGAIPSIRINSAVRYHLGDLRAYIDTQREVHRVDK